MAGRVYWAATEVGALHLAQSACSLSVPAALVDDFVQALADSPYVEQLALLLNDELVCIMIPVKERIEIKNMTTTLSLSRAQLNQLYQAISHAD